MSERDPVATLDELLIEDPYGSATDEAMVVAGDLLQARGDSRGELIVLEQALARAPDRLTRIARRAELEAWLDQHDQLLLGLLAWMRKRPSMLRYEFRGGRLRRLYIDARRALVRANARARGTTLSLDELMQALFGVPVLRRLTELQVRVHKEADTVVVLSALEKVGRKIPLESVIVSTTTRPLDHLTRGHVIELRKHFPHLWMATRVARLAPLLEPELTDVTTAHELFELGGKPMNRDLRVRIGRGLTSGREETTKIACELIGALGESARVFAPTIDMLLRPHVSHAPMWLLPALPTFAPWVSQLTPRVASITGNPEHYPDEIRSLAGTCLSKLASR